MDKLYHYTSIETLYNMLEKSVITDKDTQVQYLNMWATHIKYLNDETERELFTDALKKAVSIYAQERNTPLDNEQLKELDILCDVDSYIISLSEHQDDLNMWRGYGGNGVGVNIEFDFNNISAFYSTSKHNHFKTEYVYKRRKCIYFQPDKCEIDNSLVEQLCDYLLHKETMQSAFNGIRIIRDIRDMATISKHIAYMSEKEWRFVCNTSSIPKHIMSNGIIKPYIEFPIPLSAITSITIGPCIKDGYDIISIKRFIKEALRSNIEIKYSIIPYRH
ncbi:MAG TPA: DUF2971 domain-containing protein [Candidatus Bacteroides avicola]|uniref:DUF2971 domain-containing protein n=1 Tax=Candidatus Bacteroides avicola TaxID=2838468 RepID=A0A9D2KV82_9BACE|nr:DUF2971 domain-containing protein [Candidatus Bacteroides avicola]